MSAEAKKHYGSSLALLALGLLALYGGADWLVLLVPVAALVWYAAGPQLGRRRN